MTRAAFVKNILSLFVLLLPYVALAAEEAAFVPPNGEELVPGVHVAGFSFRFENANCGWIEMADRTLLVDLPRGLNLPAFLTYVAELTGKPVREFVLTSEREGDAAIIGELEKLGVQRIDTSAMKSRTPIGDATIQIDYLPYGKVTGTEGGAVYLPRRAVLFGGPAIVHGPRVNLANSDTFGWLAELDELSELRPKKVIPGFGSWGGPEVLERQQKFLDELRQQVALGVAMGLPRPMIVSQAKLPNSYFVWMPYDTPTVDDIQHVYNELTVPIAPFAGNPPDRNSKQAHALVLIGDRVHEPEHLEKGLRPVFEAARVVPHFTVDFRAVTAENLACVSIFVILRDGMIWPEGDEKPYQKWMTPEQERAVEAFVLNGGGMLSLHNSMGLFPEDGPYLKLVGGRYTGHGPLERFKVKVVDNDHPVTRGISDYFIADEQHTPDMEPNKGHVLLKSFADEGVTASAGWVYEPGKGRVCHLANGHTRDALGHPMYQKLMGNAVLWLVKRQ